MLMTPDERKEFLNNCNLLGISPFEGLGYQIGQKFKLEELEIPFAGETYHIPREGTLITFTSHIQGYAWFIGENGKKYLLSINQVIPDESTRVPSAASDMSDTRN